MMRTAAVVLLALLAALPVAFGATPLMIRGSTNYGNHPNNNAHCVHCTLLDSFMRNITMNVHRLRPFWYPSPWSAVTDWKNVAPFWHVNGGYYGGNDGMLLGHESVRRTRNGQEEAFAAPDDLAFVVVHNRPGQSLLEQSLRAHNIKFYRLGRRYRPWDFFGKVGPVLRAIQEGEIKEKYVAYMDARDVFLARDPADLVKNFLSYDCDLLLASSGKDEPPNPVHKRFEMRVSPWSHHHNFLSDAGWIGKTSELEELFEELQTAWRRNKLRKCTGSNDDQREWRCLHMRHYPRVKVDSLALFMSEHNQWKDKL